jgi:uncharacterized membrane protein
VSTDRRLAWGLASGGLIGLLAAAVLLIERVRLGDDSTYVPTCSINPVLSCGSVMETTQAALLGFPNPIIGVAAFPVVVTTGVVILAGGQLARWYWVGLQLGVTAAVGLVAWLAFQSIYRIGALCPYCMVVWAVVIPIFWYVTLRNLAHGVLGQRLRGSRAAALAGEWHALLLLVPYLLLIGLIAQRFWSYWSTLL